MTVEQQPLELNKQRQAGVQARSGLRFDQQQAQHLQSAANALKSSLSQEAYAATSSDATIATATTTLVGAATGSYAVHIANLAAAHTSIQSLRRHSTVVGTGNAEDRCRRFDLRRQHRRHQQQPWPGFADAINIGEQQYRRINATIITDTWVRASP